MMIANRILTFKFRSRHRDPKNYFRA